MNSTSQIKTHFDIKVIIFFITFFTFSCLLLLVKYKMQSGCNVSDFKMEASSLKAGELIVFSDTTNTGTKWKWQFGDSTKTSYLSKVSHVFMKEGKYNVKLSIDDNCNIEKEITILPSEVRIVNSDMPNFYAPKTVTLGKIAQFRDMTANAKSWEWRFGEGSSITDVDATDKNPSYVYKTPGKKTISLVVNGDYKQIKKATIFVKEIKEVRQERVSVLPDPVKLGPEIGGINETSLESMLIGISKNKLAYKNFEKYFCDYKLAKVHYEDDIISLQEFDKIIRGKSIKIKSLKIEKGSHGCVDYFVANVKIRLFEPPVH
jgi:hypothetical protein